MRKTQIALAAVALVASSAALADVKVYGSVDGGLVFGGGSAVTAFSQGEWSGNQMGFSASEDLGGGLKAGVQLEAGFGTTNGATNNGGGSSMFNRLANVSLGGDFGSVKAGMQFSPFVGAYLSTLPQTHGGFHVPALVMGGLADGGGGGLGNSNSATGGFFIPNAISYSTPSIGGFSASIINAQAGDGNTGKLTGGAVNYAMDNITLTAAMSDRNGIYKNMLYGGSVSMGPVKVGLNVATADVAAQAAVTGASPDYTSTSNATVAGTKASAAVTAAKTTTTTIGASYALSEAASLGVNYSRTSASASLLNLNAVYNLSKSTSLYVFYNDAGGATTHSSYTSFLSTATGTGTHTAQGVNSYGAGLAVNF